MSRHDYSINHSILEHAIGRIWVFCKYIPFVRITRGVGVETM